MTVLFLFPDRTCRVDAPAAGGAPAASATWRSGRIAAPDAIALALRGGEGLPPVRRGGRVAVLAEDAFAQTVRLSLRQTAGLSKDELAAALAFEAEPLSGLSSAGAETGWLRRDPIDGEAAYDVVQIARPALAALARAVSAARAELAGAGALPPELDPEDAAALARAAQAVADGRSALVRPRVGRLAAWRRELVAGGALFALVAAVGAWFCAEALREDRAASAAWTEAEALSRGNRLLRAELRRAEAAAAAPAGAPAAPRGRAAWSMLLDALAEAFAGRVSVRGISTLGPFDLRIEGVAPDPAAQEEGMLALSRRAAPAGWAVVPEYAAPVRPGAESSPWRFSFRVLRTGALPAPMPQATDYSYDESQDMGAGN